MAAGQFLPNHIMIVIYQVYKWKAMDTTVPDLIFLSFWLKLFSLIISWQTILTPLLCLDWCFSLPVLIVNLILWLLMLLSVKACSGTGLMAWVLSAGSEPSLITKQAYRRKLTHPERREICGKVRNIHSTLLTYTIIMLVFFRVHSVDHQIIYTLGSTVRPVQGLLSAARSKALPERDLILKTTGKLQDTKSDVSVSLWLESVNKHTYHSSCYLSWFKAAGEKKSPRRKVTPTHKWI